jgi:hypothetical protein
MKKNIRQQKTIKNLVCVALLKNEAINIIVDLQKNDEYVIRRIKLTRSLGSQFYVAFALNFRPRKLSVLRRTCSQFFIALPLNFRLLNTPQKPFPPVTS